MSPGFWIAFAGVGTVLFHLAHLPRLGALALAVPFCWVPLVKREGSRIAFYGGVTMGLAVFAPQLAFFGTIFGWPAMALWLILSFWTGLFVLVCSHGWRRFPPLAMLVVVPVIWTGWEYFRSELYYLRFSWITPGLVAADGPAAALLPWIGSYGLGFVAFLAAAVAWFGSGLYRGMALALPGLVLVAGGAGVGPVAPGQLLEVAGAQTESASEADLPGILDRARSSHPGARLFLLPEYALEGAPGPELRSWCRRHEKHLVVGGRERIDAQRFRNVAFVVDPRGDVVFGQAKSVPIQFFQDGEPAVRQDLWQSPWGPIGIAICYDLSYTRVMDRLVRQGAVALIIPTMDAWDWGSRQHALHARVAPVRAAEYRIPILRCASSGISQLVDAQGQVRTSAPMSDGVLTFGGVVELGPPGSLPWDRWLAPGCAGLALALSGSLAFLEARERIGSRRSASAPGPTVPPAPSSRTE